MFQERFFFSLIISVMYVDSLPQHRTGINLGHMWTMQCALTPQVDHQVEHLSDRPERRRTTALGMGGPLQKYVDPRIIRDGSPGGIPGLVLAGGTTCSS